MTQNAVDLSTTYLGLQLKNPIVASSSGLTNSLDGVRRCAEAGAGAIVLKSIFEEEVVAATEALDPGEDLDHGYPAEARDYLERYGRENALAETLQLIRDAKRELDVPVIASIHCYTSGGWTELAGRFQEAGADALELNVFVLPADPERRGADNEQVTFAIAREVTRRVSIPVALKVGPYFAGLAHSMIQLSRTGIGGLVLFNRFFPIDFNLETQEIVPGVVYSTPAEMQMSLRWISILAGRTTCDLAASTGVHDGAAVIKQLMAGAAAVQVCSALYQNGVGHLATMLDDVRQWMGVKGYERIAQFRGSLSQKHAVNPATYERFQFMKSSGIA